MAEADNRHYNLRSGTSTVQLPVQIHMSDPEFLTQISQNHHNSDSDDSADSELDCSAVIENSNTDHTTGTESKQSTSSTPSTLLAYFVGCCHSTGNKRSNFSTAFIYQ